MVTDFEKNPNADRENSERQIHGWRQGQTDRQREGERERERGGG